MANPKKKEHTGSLKVIFQAADPSVIDITIHKLVLTLNSLNLAYKGPICLPTKKRALIVNRDECDYEKTLHITDANIIKRFLIIPNITSSELDSLINIDIPSTVHISFVQD